MMIACPRCGASYRVDAALFGSRPRTVQCSACDWRWTRPPPDGSPEGAAAKAVVAEAVSAARVLAGAAADGPGDAGVLDPWDVPFDPDPPPPPTSPPAAPFSADDRGPPPDPQADDAPAEPSVSSTAPPMEEDTADGAPSGDVARGEGEATPEPATTPSSSAPPEPGRGKWRFALPRSRGFVAGTTAAATVAALVSVLVALRQPIMASVPAATGFYAMLGLTPDPLGAGLEIRDVSSLREREGGEDVLTVTGVVANVAEHPAALPRLRVSLYDAQDEELQFVTVPNARPDLDPGETLHFDARIADPRPEARRVRVGFTPAPPS